MQEQAYAVLTAIRRGDADRLSAHQGWLEALQTIRWALVTEEGVALTDEGRQALEDMDRARQRPH